MSWDIVLIHSAQKIQSIEELDETQLIDTDFCAVLNNHFKNCIKNENHIEATGDGYLIDYYIDEEPVSNKMLSLYGENGLFELVALAKKNTWQIFDTSLNHMIDLDNPANNGYENFQRYRSQILD